METEKADLFWITLAKCRRHHKRLKSRPINVENDMATKLIFREISWETPKDGARFQEGIFFVNMSFYISSRQFPGT